MDGNGKEFHYNGNHMWEFPRGESCAKLWEFLRGNPMGILCETVGIPTWEILCKTMGIPTWEIFGNPIRTTMLNFLGNHNIL